MLKKLIILVSISFLLQGCATSTYDDMRSNTVDRIVIRDTSGQLYSITTGLMLSNDGNAYLHKLDEKNK